MKKLITLIACLAITGGAFAQGKGGDFNKFTLGGKLGLNVANLVGSDMEGKAKAGFHIGVVGEYRVSHLFAIAPEIMYSSQGTREKEEDYKASLNANYLNIPILARFYVIDALSIEVGPQFGFNMGMKAKAKGDGVSLTEKIDKEAYNVFDLGLGLGLTYNFRNCFASARYNFGLTNVANEGANRNSVFQLSVGYNFLRN